MAPQRNGLLAIDTLPEVHSLNAWALIQPRGLQGRIAEGEYIIIFFPFDEPDMVISL
jgi:hypothetical protein